MERTEFQFHEGPIKTDEGQPDKQCIWLFQFHEGPIKTLTVTNRNGQVARFQFHEGPIKTRSCYPYS